MDKIIIKVPETPDREIELAPGVHKAGRSAAADLQIDHPSVSGSHCEIIISNGTITVKDLGSTNGTFLDGQRVRECQILPGQTLRLGEVEVLCGLAPGLKAGLKLAAVPAAPVPLAAPQVPLTAPRPLRRPRNFYKSIPGAFLYPFKRNGLLLLIVGTVIFGVFAFFLSLRFNGLLMVGGVVGAIGAALITGYIFLYMQTIITSTALGEDEMPHWPEYESWWDSAAQPYFRLLGIWVACLVPAILGGMFVGQAGQWLLIPLSVAGFCYAPMALLAVAMDDSLLGLNPLLVVPTIMRVPWEYLVSCLLLGVLLVALGELTWLTEGLHQRFVSLMVGLFLGLYFSVVEMRLLGLLYYTRKERIGWRA